MTTIEPTDGLALERYRRVMNHEGIEPNHLLEKSALYRRLIEGGRPLVVPPPLSHSYPWYDAVESAVPLEIMEPHELQADEDFMGRSGLLIEQDLWTLIDGAGATEKRVTYPGWAARGFSWRVWRERVPAEKAGAVLYCHHDPAARRITSPEQVDAEARYFVQRDYELLKLVATLPLDQAVESIQAEYEAKNPSPTEGAKIRRTYNQRLARYEAESYAARLEMRRIEELPDLPSEEELAARMLKERERVLGSSWEIADGKLWRWCWFLQRETPVELGPDHYLSI